MPISWKDNDGNEIVPDWRQDDSGSVFKVMPVIYEESADKKYHSEKHYAWFLSHKDSKEFKDKKKIQNQFYYKRKAEKLRKNRVSRYHKSNPNARYNDMLSTRFRQFIHLC